MARKKKQIARIPRKESSAPVSLAPSPWDMGAEGEANRKGLVVEPRGEVDAHSKMHNPNNVKGVRRVDMLEYWHRHGTISTAGFNAATALRDAFEHTQRSPGTSFEQDRVDSSPKPDHAVTIQIDRISKFHKVNRYLAKEDTAFVHHCVLGGGIPATWRIKGERPYHGARYPAGLKELAAALERLAKAMGG